VCDPIVLCDMCVILLCCVILFLGESILSLPEQHSPALFIYTDPSHLFFVVILLSININIVIKVSLKTIGGKWGVLGKAF